MSTEEVNKNIKLCPKSFYNLKSIQWNVSQYKCFVDQMRHYTSSLTSPLPIIPFSDIIDLFQMDTISKPNTSKFKKLSESNKSIICMALYSVSYIRYLIDYFHYLLKEFREEEDIYKWIDSYTDEFGGFRNTRYLINDTERRIIEHNSRTQKSLSLNGPILHCSKIPSLREVFHYLIQIKHTVQYSFELLYSFLGQLSSSLLDIKTYNILLESILNDDYYNFRNIVLQFDPEIVKQFSITIECVFPTALFIEYYSSNYNDFETYRTFISGPITKDKMAFETSMTGFIHSILLIGVCRANHIREHLTLIESKCLDLFWVERYLYIKKEFFFNWIDKEAILIFDHFTDHLQDYLPEDTIAAALHSELTLDRNKENLTSENIINEFDIQDREEEDSFLNQVQRNYQEQNLEPRQSTNDENSEQTPIIKPKTDIPDYIKVPCGQRMLEKLINGLINGHKDETLGNFTPLVSSKKGEDKESIKKKLICLFTGEGINDESIKWPYDLKWNDKANSLKLLVYLLLYEGIVLSLSDAVDENNYDGICEKIKTNFTGKHVWNIVGNALSFKSLRNKAKIPKESNISLMKKLASFYIDCQKLDD